MVELEGFEPSTSSLPSQVSHWSLRSVQLKLVKIGARVVSHSRRTVFHCSEVSFSASLFAELLQHMRRLTAVPTCWI